MRRSHDKSFVHKFWVRRAVLIALLVLILLLGMSVWGVYGKYKEVKERKEELAQALGELEKREIDLKQKVGALDTERGIEGEIRSKFQVAKEGEGVIYLVDNVTTTERVDVPKKSIWGWLLGWLGF